MSASKPPISALYLVRFDQKVGYTITWKRALPSIDLSGVEFKSLPSGLHAVQEDLIYYMHGQHAGVSAFAQGEADASHRGANFVAVGALVPLSEGFGRLGRSWIHADELRGLAREVLRDGEDKRTLEAFWKKHQWDESKRRTSSSGQQDGSLLGIGVDSRKRRRALSEGTLAGFNAEHAACVDHPALHARQLLDTWGPLIFPLYRAALSRKRILFLGSPSVQDNANTVYLISILSGIPNMLVESLPSEASELLRSLPLFSVGINDIDMLKDTKSWLACTTDDILGEKKDLYDLLVKLPNSSPSSHRAWPQLQTSDGRILKATQRDLQRWTLLRRELRRLQRQTTSYTDDPSTESDSRPLLQRNKTSTSSHSTTTLLQDRDLSSTIEPSTWTSLAYRSFIWWASAGEAAAWETSTTQADEELLFDLPTLPDHPLATATLLTAFFRRITAEILKPMANIVEEADDSTEEGIEEDVILISGEEIRGMGLDVWSENDKFFVREMMRVWFGREVEVMEEGWRVCGLRVC